MSRTISKFLTCIYVVALTAISLPIWSQGGPPPTSTSTGNADSWKVEKPSKIETNPRIGDPDKGKELVNGETVSQSSFTFSIKFDRVTDSGQISLYSPVINKRLNADVRFNIAAEKNNLEKPVILVVQGNRKVTLKQGNVVLTINDKETKFSSTKEADLAPPKPTPTPASGGGDTGGGSGGAAAISSKETDQLLAKIKELELAIDANKKVKEELSQALTKPGITSEELNLLQSKVSELVNINAVKIKESETLRTRLPRVYPFEQMKGILQLELASYKKAIIQKDFKASNYVFTELPSEVYASNSAMITDALGSIVYEREQELEHLKRLLSQAQETSQGMGNDASLINNTKAAIQRIEADIQTHYAFKQLLLKQIADCKAKGDSNSASATTKVDTLKNPNVMPSITPTITAMPTPTRPTALMPTGSPSPTSSIPPGELDTLKVREPANKVALSKSISETSATLMPTSAPIAAAPASTSEPYEVELPNGATLLIDEAQTHFNLDGPNPVLTVFSGKVTYNSNNKNENPTFRQGDQVTISGSGASAKLSVKKLSFNELQTLSKQLNAASGEDVIYLAGNLPPNAIRVLSRSADGTIMSVRLLRDQVVNGIPLKKDTTAWFYADGSLARGTLARQHAFRGINLKANTEVELYSLVPFQNQISLAFLSEPHELFKQPLSAGSILRFDPTGRIWLQSKEQPVAFSVDFPQLEADIATLKQERARLLQNPTITLEQLPANLRGEIEAIDKTLAELVANLNQLQKNFHTLANSGK